MRLAISYAIVISLFANSVLAQFAATAPPAPPGDQDLVTRLNQLEGETQVLRAEVARLRDQTVRLPAIPDPSTSLDTTVAATTSSTATSAYVEPQDEYYTLDQLRGEMKKLVWKKGDFSITPYGWLWGNSVYSTQRTSPGSYTLFVQSATTQPEGEFLVDARNTRIGFDVGGPKIACLNDAVTGGKLEVDFQNNTVNAGSEHRGSLLLRHAYAEAKNDDYRILVGQTWDVISPLNPGMLMYSVGWDGGNIGYRRAQFRGEKFFNFSDVSMLTTQFSINQTVVPDGITGTTVGPAEWPILEGRAGWTIGHHGKDDLPIVVGVSGHIGNTAWDYTALGTTMYRPTWSGNIDIRIPITERLGFQAEMYTGENLSAFLGGIGQGINPIALNSIRDHGGWCEFWYYWQPNLHTHVGYSFDDPLDSDLSVALRQKSYNQFFFGNICYDVTKKLLVGLEVSSWKTVYLGAEPGNAVRSEFVVKYGF